MKKSLFAGAIALALVGPLASAETTSSATTTRSTTTSVESSHPEYTSTRTEQQVDQYGNVIKKSSTYKSANPVTGESSSSSSTSVESPDGSTSTVEQARTSDGTYSGTKAVETRTTTTTH